MISWLQANWLEIFGTTSGFLYLYFSYKQLIWLWPLGIVTSASYVFVFFEGKIYADMSLNIYYVLVSIYGWLVWSKNKTNNSPKVEILSASAPLILKLMVVVGVLFGLFSYILSNYTNSDVPYIDAFTTASSVVATWMLAKRMLENWLFWVVIDVVSIGLYVHKGLYVTVALFAAYTVIAVFGYFEWKRHFKIAYNEFRH